MNLVAKVQIKKMSTPQKNAQCISWFIETSQTSKHSKTLDASMEESHLDDLPFEHDIKSLWRLVVCYRERAGRPKLSEKIKSVQVAYTRSPRKSICEASTQLQIPPFTKFFIQTCNFMHIKCNYCKPLSQKINCNEKNLQ